MDDVHQRKVNIEKELAALEIELNNGKEAMADIARQKEEADDVILQDEKTIHQFVVDKKLHRNNEEMEQYMGKNAVKISPEKLLVLNYSISLTEELARKKRRHSTLLNKRTSILDQFDPTREKPMTAHDKYKKSLEQQMVDIKNKLLVVTALQTSGVDDGSTDERGVKEDPSIERGKTPNKNKDDADMRLKTIEVRKIMRENQLAVKVLKNFKMFQQNARIKLVVEGTNSKNNDIKVKNEEFRRLICVRFMREIKNRKNNEPPRGSTGYSTNVSEEVNLFMKYCDKLKTHPDYNTLTYSAYVMTVLNERNSNGDVCAYRKRPRVENADITKMRDVRWNQVLIKRKDKLTDEVIRECIPEYSLSEDESSVKSTSEAVNKYYKEKIKALVCISDGMLVADTDEVMQFCIWLKNSATKPHNIKLDVRGVGFVKGAPAYFANLCRAMRFWYIDSLYMDGNQAEWLKQAYEQVSDMLAILLVTVDFDTYMETTPTAQNIGESLRVSKSQRKIRDTKDIKLEAENAARRALNKDYDTFLRAEELIRNESDTSSYAHGHPLFSGKKPLHRTYEQNSKIQASVENSESHSDTSRESSVGVSIDDTDKTQKGHSTIGGKSMNLLQEQLHNHSQKLVGLESGNNDADIPRENGETSTDNTAGRNGKHSENHSIPEYSEAEMAVIRQNYENDNKPGMTSANNAHVRYSEFVRYMKRIKHETSSVFDEMEDRETGTQYLDKNDEVSAKDHDMENKKGDSARFAYGTDNTPKSKTDGSSVYSDTEEDSPYSKKYDANSGVDDVGGGDDDDDHEAGDDEQHSTHDIKPAEIFSNSDDGDGGRDGDGGSDDDDDDDDDDDEDDDSEDSDESEDDDESESEDDSTDGKKKEENTSEYSDPENREDDGERSPFDMSRMTTGKFTNELTGEYTSALAGSAHDGHDSTDEDTDLLGYSTYYHRDSDEENDDLQNMSQFSSMPDHLWDE